MGIDREGPIQIAIVKYLRAILPKECVVVHIKNEINKRGKAFAIEQAKAKRKGVVTGFPDLMVLPFATVGPVFFEVKAEGNYPTEAQRGMHKRITHLGYPCAVVRSVDDVKECLHEWGVFNVKPSSGAVSVRGTIS